MKQPIFTPEILPCKICGAKAEVLDWEFRMRYRVMCDNNHMIGGECNTVHRAVCRWNNKQIEKEIKNDARE